MKQRLVALMIVAVLVVSGVQLTSAAPRPTIITFDASLAAITVADAEAGETTAMLSWHTVGMTDEYRLLLHTYMLDEWELVYSDSSVPLEANGSRSVTVRHPLNFGPPTFLLSIVSKDTNTIVDQRTATIAYADAADVPAITEFATEAEDVDAQALAAAQVQIMVAWAVENRPASANLVFEQVFEDGTATSIELPRVNLWIPSTGEGPVAPIHREGAESVTIKLRLVDQVDGEVYAEEMIELPVVNKPPDDSTEPGDTAEPQPVESGDIVAFTATPGTVNPGAAVTLNWEIAGTGGVVIDQAVPNMTQVSTVVTAQSPKGSAEVYLPDYAAYSVRFTLWTANRTASKDITVNVYCPYTFFFGEADGCPAGQPFSVGVTYQEFEGGYMIWRSDTNEIYVHYTDGTAAYFLEQDYAQLDMPDLEGMPPLDRSAPASGFGKVWANAPGVRDKLGWALSEEQGYDTTLQRVAQTRSPHPEFAFFVTLPDGAVAGSGYGVWRVVK